MTETRDENALASEARIIRGLRQGDRAAWTELYEAYNARIWRHVARLVGSDAGVVADVVQETFLSAARSAANFDPSRGTLWAWLCGIAHHLACGVWRQHARNDQLRERALAHNVPWASPGADPAAPLQQQESADAVRTALNQLPADYALLLTAKYIEGLNMAQIQQQHGGTMEALRSRLARARREFQAVFTRFAPSQPQPLTTPTRSPPE